MKITKQRLKEIIKEELASVTEADEPTAQEEHKDLIRWSADWTEEEWKKFKNNFKDWFNQRYPVGHFSDPFREELRGLLTKQRLKEIIKEELANLSETGKPVGSDIENISSDAPGLADVTTQEKYATSDRSPEQLLVDKLFERENIDAGMNAEQVAQIIFRDEGAAAEPEVVELVDDIMRSKFLDNPRVEEARETAAQRTKRKRAESRRKTQEKKADPRVQAVDRASQAHIAKEKEKRKSK